MVATTMRRPPFLIPPGQVGDLQVPGLHAAGAEVLVEQRHRPEEVGVEAHPAVLGLRPSGIDQGEARRGGALLAEAIHLRRSVWRHCVALKRTLPGRGLPHLISLNGRSVVQLDQPVDPDVSALRDPEDVVPLAAAGEGRHLGIARPPPTEVVTSASLLVFAWNTDVAGKSARMKQK